MENLSAEVIEGKLAIEKNAQVDEMKQEFKKMGSEVNFLRIFFGYFVSVGSFLFATSYFEVAQEHIYISLGVFGVIFFIQVEAIKTNKRIDLHAKIMSNEYQKVDS